jgi:lipoprotein NlpI
MNSFDLILQKRYDDAIKQAEISFNETKCKGELCNKIIALLNLDKFTDAYTECKKLLPMGEDNAYYSLYALCCYMLSLKEEAENYLQLDLNGKYTDESYGVNTLLFLYYVNGNTKLLKQKIKRKDIKEYPYCLAAYVLDKIDKETLLEAVKKEVELKERILCKCYFYIYCKEKQMGEKNYMKYLNKILKFFGNSVLESEYYLARYEVKK